MSSSLFPLQYKLSSLQLDCELNIKWKFLLYPPAKQLQNLANRKIYVRVGAIFSIGQQKDLLKLFLFFTLVAMKYIRPKAIQFNLPWFNWRHLDTIEYLLIQLKMLHINYESLHGILQTRTLFYSQVPEHIFFKGDFIVENVTTELQGCEHAVVIIPPDTMKPAQVNYLSKPTYSLETSLFWQNFFPFSRK